MHWSYCSHALSHRFGQPRWSEIIDCPRIFTENMHNFVGSAVSTKVWGHHISRYREDQVLSPIQDHNYDVLNLSQHWFNELSPVWHQPYPYPVSTYELSSTEPLWTNFFSEIWIQIQKVSFQEMTLKILSAKCLQFRPDLYMLKIRDTALIIWLWTQWINLAAIRGFRTREAFQKCIRALKSKSS